MRAEEARTIARWAISLGLPVGSVCLNIGSSTARFRQETQPHIHAELIGPLEDSGLRVVHCDMKPSEGVDEVGDVFDPSYQERLRAYRADLLICSNLLEHLTNPAAFAAACASLVAPGGYAIVTVPYSYPYHPDPIDTRFRPSPAGIVAMFPQWQAVESKVLADGSLWHDLVKTGRPWRRLGNHVARTIMPFYRSSQWPHIAEGLLWLKRSYKVSMVLLRKQPDPSLAGAE